MFTWNVFASISFNIHCKWTFCISYFFSGSHYQRCRATSVVKRNIVPTVFFFTMVFLLRLFRKRISLLSSLFHSNRFFANFFNFINFLLKKQTVEMRLKKCFVWCRKIINKTAICECVCVFSLDRANFLRSKILLEIYCKQNMFECVCECRQAKSIPNVYSKKKSCIHMHISYLYTYIMYVVRSRARTPAYMTVWCEHDIIFSFQLSTKQRGESWICAHDMRWICGFFGYF